jgi:hypothetical protein
MVLLVKMTSAFGVLEYQKLQITMTKVSVFRFEILPLIFLFPDT